MHVAYQQFETNKGVSRSDAEQIQKLVAELVGNPDIKVLVSRIAAVARGGIIYVARQELDHLIVGMATLMVLPKMSGTCGVVEDVVVLASHRGWGIGESLVRHLIVCARAKLALRSIELTSNPTRVAANGLYQKLGFQLYETNMYRLVL